MFFLTPDSVDLWGNVARRGPVHGSLQSMLSPESNEDVAVGGLKPEIVMIDDLAASRPFICLVEVWVPVSVAILVPRDDHPVSGLN